MRPRDTRLNTPSEMLVRFVYASRFICFFVGLFFVASALHHDSALDALRACVLFTAMLAGHLWLKRSGKLDECDRALAAMFEEGAENGDELDKLLYRRAELESRRGTPGFDPWEVQAVRREISDYVRTHPESTGRLDGRRW